MRRTCTPSGRAHTRARSRAPMLAGLATWAIVGHSERRRDQGETDALIGRKLVRCAEAGLRPILCVGEQLDEREAGRRREDGSRPARGLPRGRRSEPAPIPATWSSPTSRSGRSAPGRTARGADAATWPRPSGRRLRCSRRRERGPPTCPCSTAAASRQRLDRGVPGRADHRRRARRRRQPQGRRDGAASSRAPRSRHAHAPRRHDRSRPAPPPAARPRPLVLVIIDGFGIGPVPADDAIASARMPAWRALLADVAARAAATHPRKPSACPPGRWATARSATSTSGAGARSLQDLPRIDAAIADGSFFENAGRCSTRSSRAAQAPVGCT